MDRSNIQQLIRNYIPFTGMLCELVKSLLESQGIKYHIVESRTKEFDSYVEKIDRKNIEENEREILDITGIRIILYYQDDLDTVESLIKENFLIDTANSVDKKSLFESNEFGYLSRHYIVQLNEERSGLMEWKRYSTFKAEIQVRTVLQHSWASISHELSYKKNYDIPKELSRKLFRLAGLFELADEQFLVIRNEHDELKLEINQLDNTELSDETINLLTLEQKLSLSGGIYDEIESIALQYGFTNSDPQNPDRYLSGVILASNYLGLKTIGQIEVLLTNEISELHLLFKKLIEISPAKWSGPKSFFLMIALIYNLSEEQLEIFSEEFNWKNSIWKRTFLAILEVKKANEK